MMVTWSLVASWMMIAAVGIPLEPHLCSVAWADSAGNRSRNNPPPTPAQIVATADVIVVASAIDTLVRSMALSPPGPRTTVSFRVTEVLKGSVGGDRLMLPGVFVERDEFNSEPVPYRSPRPSALRGGCVTWEYRKNASYLLMLSRDEDSSLSTTWGSLLPVNEQLRSGDDAWLAWVRGQLQRSR